MSELYDDFSEMGLFNVEIYRHEYRITSRLSSLFQKIRMEKNLSLDKISSDLNISIEQLEDIESDDYFDLNLIIKIFDYLGYELQPTFSTI